MIVRVQLGRTGVRTAREIRWHVVRARDESRPAAREAARVVARDPGDAAAPGLLEDAVVRDIAQEIGADPVRKRLVQRVADGRHRGEAVGEAEIGCQRQRLPDPHAGLGLRRVRGPAVAAEMELPS